MKQEFDFDYIVIGSGFGGSVSAFRLAEKGYSVGVMEMGRRWKAVSDGYVPFPLTRRVLQRVVTTDCKVLPQRVAKR